MSPFKLFEKRISPPVALFFLLLAVLELILIFSPLPVFLVRKLNFSTNIVTLFEAIAVPITVFVLGSYGVQKLGKLSIGIFRAGFILALILGIMNLSVLLNNLRWLLAIMGTVLSPFNPLLAIADPIFSKLWGGFLGAAVAYGFVYLALGPLLAGLLASLIYYAAKIHQGKKVVRD